MTLERAAERALVGALLVEPDRLDDVGGWLRPDDFEGVAECQAFHAMTELRRRDQPVTPERVDALLRSELATGTQLAGPVYLVAAMQDTPDPTRAVVYGRMVLELSIRRHVEADAVSLKQRAEGAETTEQLNVVFAHVDKMRRNVEALHQRESRAAQLHSVAPLNYGGLRSLERFPRYEHGVVERRAILGLVERPNSLPNVTRWLRTNDFSDDEAGALYAELVALHDANNPIDRVTVAWRAAKVGIEGPICDELVDVKVTQSVDPDPAVAARRVLEQSVQSAVVATSEELAVAARDPGTDATSAAYARLNALWPQQRRLVKARFTQVD